MNAVDAEKITAKVASFLDECWKIYPKMLGHGVRTGADGKPEVFVAFLEKTRIPDEVNGIRIVSEVRGRAYLA